jgi:hypothetical protein
MGPDMKRHLAVLIVDVIGYRSLSEIDEEGTRVHRAAPFSRRMSIFYQPAKQV